MVRYILVISLLVICIQSFGQEESKFNLSSFLDEVLISNDQNANYENLYESFSQLLSHPLDLNTATYEQLLALRILKPGQIKSILRRRDEGGQFISPYELQTIEGLDEQTFQKIIHFVTVNNIDDKKIWVRPSSNYVILRWGRTLEEQRGYQSSTDSARRYQGAPDKTYIRWRSSRPGKFSSGLTAEKDAGEKLKWGKTTKGFDYISYHVQFENKGRFKNLILGDYRAQFGQGITIGSVFGLGKNAEAVLSTRRSSIGFIPYTSIDEFGYFRGAAVSFEVHRNLYLHGFTSKHRIDATIRNDSTDSTTEYISSLPGGGLHRTLAEIQSKKTVVENSEGMAVEYKNRKVSGGALVHQNRWSLPLFNTPNIYNDFSFRGSSLTNAGGWLNYYGNNISLFGEVSHTYSQGTACIGGGILGLSQSVDMVMIYRSYARNYQNFYSNALSENSSSQNEQGYYWGLKMQPNKKFSLSGYLDLFRFPWLKYQTYRPSQGHEWLLRISYKINKNNVMFLQLKEESKARNNDTTSAVYKIAEALRRNIILHADYQGSKNLQLRSRVQINSYSFNNSYSYGIMVLQDMTLSTKYASFSGRIVLFDAPDFENRFYVYEPDATMAFSFPSYYGRGIRRMLMAEVKIASNLTLWLRWVQTRFVDRTEIGSDGELIQGNTRNDVKVQLKWNLF